MEFKKKFIIFMFMFSSLFYLGFSADIYLTECGNSGWDSNNNYYINLTNPYITSGSECFKGDLNHINITQLNEKIIISSSAGTYHFFQGATNYKARQYSNFKNLNIEFENSPNTQTFFGNVGCDDIFQHNTFYNCSFKGGNRLWSGGCNGGTLYCNYNNFYNCEILGLTSDIFYLNANDHTHTRSIRYNNFYNTLISTETTNLFVAVTNAIALDNKMYNSVATYNYGGLSKYTSIVKGNTDTDNNDDNIGDNNINVLMSVNAGLSKHNYTFLQDIKEGLIFSEANRINIPMNTLNLSSSNLLPIGNNKIFDFSYITANIYSNFFNVQVSGIDSKLVCDVAKIGDNGRICSINVWSDTFSSNKFRPTIAVGHNNIEISGQEIIKQNVDTNGNLIANLQDLTYNDILIKDNSFYSAKSEYGNNEDLANNYIKLKVTNLNLYNNKFFVTSYNSSNKFEILYIDSTNKVTNEIYRNIFNDSRYFDNGNITRTEVFTHKCDTKFYNNYLGRGVVVSDLCGLDYDFYVGYPHTDGKIYYFKMGNYYEDNSGCVDVNSDGFCDNSYTSGAVIDDKPLSVYPFDYTSHLFTADYIVTPNSYNITTPNLNDGETANLNSNSDGIVLYFSENGDYPDLTCNYILDGVVIATKTEPEKDIIYNYTKYGGWTEKNYSYRVECFNDVQGYISSIEKTFNVVIGGGGSSGGNETGGNETGGNTDNIFGTMPDLISGNISETAENTGEFIGDFSNGITNLIIPIGFFIVMVLVVGGTIALIS